MYIGDIEFGVGVLFDVVIVIGVDCVFDDHCVIDVKVVCVVMFVDK